MSINVDACYNRPVDQKSLKTVRTTKGLVTIKKSENQNQCFERITVQMKLEEAVEWAMNTTTFKPLIREHIYAPTFTAYAIVKPVIDNSLQIKPTIETLWEI
jgi:hypothetical protein